MTMMVEGRLALCWFRDILAHYHECASMFMIVLVLRKGTRHNRRMLNSTAQLAYINSRNHLMARTLWRLGGIRKCQCQFGQLVRLWRLQCDAQVTQ
jgi:hypothetical protein